MFQSPDGDTDLFDIVGGVFLWDTLALYLFVICFDYVLRTSIDHIKENSFTLKKRQDAETIINADYTDDLALLANTLTQAKFLLHSLEQTAGDINLHVNANKIVFMSFKRERAISTQSERPLKLVGQFTYVGSNISSTESDFNIRLTKAWTAIDRLSIILKSDLSDKIKQGFCQAVAVPILLYGCTTWTLTKRVEKKLNRNYTRLLRAILYKSWKQHPLETIAVQPLTSHLKNHPNQTNKTCGTLLEKQGRTHKWRSSMDPFTWTCQSWPTNKNLFTSALFGHKL